jgi:hypothetical protein
MPASLRAGDPVRTLRHHASRPASAPLVADDVVEFHAARLVLLLGICGGSSAAITGLTKLAKLDFFVRYPDFFNAVIGEPSKSAPGRSAAIEAAMIRHHYGPWDKRYYHVLAFLEARGLVSVNKTGKSVRISLTRLGKTAVQRLSNQPAFAGLCRQMESVAERLGSSTGNQLKNLVYQTFTDEVARRPLGQVIRSTAHE